MTDLMIRDHALHLYFFVLPDVLGIDSILDIPDDHDNLGHVLLHDSFDIKKIGTEITNVIIGAAIHAPLPVPGGFLSSPDQAKFPDLVAKLEAIRPQVIKGIKTFYEWQEKLDRNSDYLYMRNDKQYDFLEGDLMNSNGKRVPAKEFLSFMEKVVIPYSESDGYVFSDTHEDFLVGSLARINFNKDVLHPRTKADVEQYLNVFPSHNLHHNNLAQAIEILQCVDDAIDILKTTTIVAEQPVRKPPQAE
jgi:coenzyme F420-reducing hydrogenase alpha subunit